MPATKAFAPQVRQGRKVLIAAHDACFRTAVIGERSLEDPRLSVAELEHLARALEADTVSSGVMVAETG